MSCAVFTSASHVVSESSAGAISIKALVGFDSFFMSKKSVILYPAFFPLLEDLQGDFLVCTAFGVELANKVYKNAQVAVRAISRTHEALQSQNSVLHHHHHLAHSAPSL
ncbi:hypothetical protein NDU88_004312 [Pleurodeles waltl]|uniref:Uncharacterized protein n=1 Tax=Pleurodeles waltl TaxID=8319 RepID=A0AAV7LHV8_PLEWA|nr:hypothetical protein NDU88_004312 [Pleurodeles waltl]